MQTLGLDHPGQPNPSMLDKGLAFEFWLKAWTVLIWACVVRCTCPITSCPCQEFC